MARAFAKPVVPADGPGSADDLWGRPPGKPVVCDGCGQAAEAYTGAFCWRCWATGQMAFVLAAAGPPKVGRHPPHRPGIRVCAVLRGAERWARDQERGGASCRPKR